MKITDMKFSEIKSLGSVKVYCDPVGKKDLEGYAKPIRKIRDIGGGLERWAVCFIGSRGRIDSTEYERTIDPQDIRS